MARPRERNPLEDGLKLDLNLLIRRGLFRRWPVCVSIRWTRSNGWAHSTEVMASGHLMWQMSARHGSMWVYLGATKQSIELEAAPRHFGGMQWYFVCPVLRCRVSVLWMPPGARQFACRQAWGRRVAYSSQFMAPDRPALARAQAIRRRLGGAIPLSEEVPQRPWFMHRKTYEALRPARRLPTEGLSRIVSHTKLLSVIFATDFDYRRRALRVTNALRIAPVTQPVWVSIVDCGLSRDAEVGPPHRTAWARRRASLTRPRLRRFPQRSSVEAPCLASWPPPRYAAVRQASSFHRLVTCAVLFRSSSSANQT
jgi:hypothetical protein